MLVFIKIGCRSSTQPRTNDSTSQNVLTLQTDSSEYHSATLWSLITVRIRNGTDSLVVFPACETISWRIDTLKQQQWSLGTPQWQQPCPAIYSTSWLLQPDSTYNLRFLIKGPATYRIVAIYSGIAQAGNPRDTLASNSFTVFTAFLPPNQSLKLTE
jgi:hypothetical protein